MKKKGKKNFRSITEKIPNRFSDRGEKDRKKERKEKKKNFIHHIIHRHNHQNPQHRARLANWQLDKRHHSPYVQVQDVRIDVIDVAEK